MSRIEHDRLNALIIDYINTSLDARLGNIIKNGELRLRGVPIAGGPLPTSAGGTGTSTGLRDHSHDGTTGQGQLLTEAHTHQSLDTIAATRKHWTREDLQDMIATGFLLAGTGVTLVYDDAANTLTINASAMSAAIYWDGSPITFDGDGLTYG